MSYGRERLKYHLHEAIQSKIRRQSIKPLCARFIWQTFQIHFNLVDCPLHVLQFLHDVTNIWNLIN